MIHMLLVLLALLQPPTVPMVAAFTTSTSAAILWEQPAGIRSTCLYRFYGARWPAAICYDDLPAGPMRVDLPGQLADPAYRPAAGDRYALFFNGAEVGRVQLPGGREVERTYLPLVAR